MIVQIYLNSNSYKTSEIMKNIRGVQNVGFYTTKINNENINLTKVEYESSDISLNTLLKYYLKSLDDNFNACVYYLDNLYINLKNKHDIEFIKINSVTVNKNSNTIINNVSIDIDKTIDRYDRLEEGLMLGFPNRVSYLLLFFLGLGTILINEMIYILPFLGLTGATQADDLNNILLNYDGFIALAAKVLVIALIIIFLPKILKNDFNLFKKKWLKCLLIPVVGFGLIVLDGLLFDNVIYKACNITTDANNEAQIITILSGKSKIPFSISIAILTPFVEEFVFRKLIFSTLKYFKFPKWLNVLIVSLLFALIHCTSEDFSTLKSWIFFVQYFSLALILTLTYVLTEENIYASSLIHALNNIYGLLLI